MYDRTSDAPRAHDQAPLSSPSDAEAPRAPALKPFTEPTLELHGSIPEITAGSNIFGG